MYCGYKLPIKVGLGLAGAVPGLWKLCFFWLPLLLLGYKSNQKTHTHELV